MMGQDASGICREVPGELCSFPSYCRQRGCLNLPKGATAPPEETTMSNQSSPTTYHDEGSQHNTHVVWLPSGWLVTHEILYDGVTVHSILVPDPDHQVDPAHFAFNSGAAIRIDQAEAE